MLYLLTQDKEWFSVIQAACRSIGDDAVQLTEASSSDSSLKGARSLLIDQPIWNSPNLSVTPFVEAAHRQNLPVFFVLTSLEPSIRNDAFRLGADEVLFKDETLDSIVKAEALHDRFELKFWGVRGTLPISGPNTLKYGGNTSSLGLQFGVDRQFVFDAGTGLRDLSTHLSRHKGGKFNGRILITHPHWDHLNCLPFFDPFYNPNSQIHLMGPPQGDLSFKAIVDGQMNGIYFPIGTDSFNADVIFGDLLPGQYVFDGITVTAIRLDHPGCCLGYRVDFKGRSVAYLTDNELGLREGFDPYMNALTDFLSGIDVLIHDCSYFDDEYPRRKSWGHSSVSQVVRLADLSKAKHLFLFHHDPEHDDQDIDRKQVEAERVMANIGSQFICHNAKQGDTFDLRTLRLIENEF